MKNDFFEKTLSARIEFEEKFFNNDIDKSAFYIIDKLDTKTSGVWALFGKPKGRSDNWFCLQVGQAENIENEIKSDIVLLESKLDLIRKKKYVNQFKESVFEYKEIPSPREFLYNYISNQYDNLIFLCIYVSDDSGERKTVESLFAKAVHALTWRNGGSYLDGEKLDLANVSSKFLNQNNIDKNINNFVNQFCKQKSYHNKDSEVEKMKTYEQMIDVFENSNRAFLENDSNLLISKVSERTLCGALMLHMHNIIFNTPEFENYYVDVEYNRNRDGKIKTIQDESEKIINIACDLILHSRGCCVEQDNLIAVEMKKSNRPQQEKDSDRHRLIALTKDSFNDVWSFDGKTLPEHVCRYILGVYYEIDYASHSIKIEYYRKGKLERNYEIKYL